MKLVVRILNIIYLAIAAVACITIFTTPLLSFNGTLTMDKSMVTTLIYPSVKDYFDSEDEFKTTLDFGEGKDTIVMNLNVSFTNSIIFQYKDKENTSKVLTDQLTPLVNETITKLEPSINNMAEKIVVKAAKGPLKNAINEQVNNINGSVTAEDLEAWGIDEEFVEEFVEEVFSIIVDGGGTVEELLETVTEKIDEVCSILQEHGVEGFEDYDSSTVDSMTEDVKQEIVDALTEAGFCDEDGNIIPIEEYLYNLLGGDGSEEGEGESEDEEESKVFKLRALTPEQEAKKKEAHDKLVVKITELLANELYKLDLPSKVEAIGPFGIGALFVLALPWLIFAIITFIRTLTKKRIVTKTWVVMTFASISLMLGVVLTIVSKYVMPKIPGMLPDSVGQIKNFLSIITVTVKTCALTSSILYLVLIPYSIVYKIFARKAKRQIKAGQ